MSEDESVENKILIALENIEVGLSDVSYSIDKLRETIEKSNEIQKEMRGRVY